MIIQRLKEIVGERYVLASDVQEIPTFTDLVSTGYFPFVALVKPASADEISQILQICNFHDMPVTPRGGGTGVTGGASPVFGGIVLSLERLNHIISIDVQNRFAIVESGVVNEVFCNAVERENMYFPISPGSRGECFIGGNIAENAGCPGSCKHGTMKDFVLNLEVVLPTGEVIWTGANVHKNATGFNLTQLFTGSEGVLGIITKAVLRIVPKPRSKTVLLAVFRDLKDACGATLELSGACLLPSAVELITQEAIWITVPYLPAGLSYPSHLEGTHLIVECEGTGDHEVEDTVQAYRKILMKFNAVEILTGRSMEEMDLLWALRRKIGFALSASGRSYRDIDSAVPPASLFAFVISIKEIATRYQRRIISFGHAMDGNMHTMLLTSDGDNNGDAGDITQMLNEIYTVAIGLGGTISGEHGIGCLQQQFLPLALSQKHIELMREIKHLFDPGHILNPGKLFLGKTTANKLKPVH